MIWVGEWEWERTGGDARATIFAKATRGRTAEVVRRLRCEVSNAGDGDTRASRPRSGQTAAQLCPPSGGVPRSQFDNWAGGVCDFCGKRIDRSGWVVSKTIDPPNHPPQNLFEKLKKLFAGRPEA
jgi:hypothetical protein